MKTKMTSVCATLLLATAVWLNADEPPKPTSSGFQPPSPQSGEGKTGSPEFERMKTLVGTWQGTTDIGQGPIDMVAQYGEATFFL